mgnify:CR=1 FL=1
MYSFDPAHTGPSHKLTCVFLEETLDVLDRLTADLGIAQEDIVTIAVFDLDWLVAELVENDQVHLSMPDRLDCMSAHWLTPAALSRRNARNVLDDTQPVNRLPSPKITFNFSEQCWEKIEQLKHDVGLRTIEVIRLGVHILDWIVDELASCGETATAPTSSVPAKAFSWMTNEVKSRRQARESEK